ncbi:hypothetical protein RJ640_001090 [Escallonia rubra]|uniref:Peptidase A1 domain-containing protein n=1 Tax=Escallonia rubra TaxID=112253 RepID=A0AA88QU49_9ASTE|nr:hypothetical protein RJ640_001090 [Escallonia rubra]
MNRFFHASVNIGTPPKPYYLDIDTGSDLTWLQCSPGHTDLLKLHHYTIMCRCGYHQEFLDTHTPPPKVDGVLGLGNGKASIVSQLSDQGVIPKVTGHCLGGQGGGYLFLGNAPVSSPGLLRAQMSSQSVKLHDNMLAPADLLYGEQPLDYGLYVAFDSGSTYTYFESQAYRATLQQVR